jgi:hypothetical protein
MKAINWEKTQETEKKYERNVMQANHAMQLSGMTPPVGASAGATGCLVFLSNGSTG